ncbi:FixH family protein [Natrinema salifodinae]|uniref:YtkA-like n=1 Tax=Natrinema salifodinae TaxID=1202768 RepID=A0A1I0P992_9EURY|nr:FixH family protein [Natrinema salifodinae]SEW10118.1 YtkA-like [Natrinema salifodinae]
MHYRKSLFALVIIAMLLTSVVGPATAHESQDVEGYEITFGGSDEPVITGERMWLQFEIVDNETGEGVTNQSENLTVSVQTEGSDKTALEVSEKHGEPGVYEAPVIFTEPGDYVAHLEGSLEGTEVHTHFEKEVQDHTELEYPADDSQATDDGDESQTDANQTEEAGFGPMAVAVAVFGIVVTIGVVLFRQQR